MTSDRVYRFGDFTLDPAGHRLLRNDVEILIPPKAFDTLLFLVEHPDRLIRKQELLDAVWPDVSVSENTLSQRIKEIRAALADDPLEPRYVKTRSRLGYSFVADVVTAGSAPPPLVSSDVIAPSSPSRTPRVSLFATAAVVLLIASLAVFLAFNRRGESAGGRQRLVSTFAGSHRSPAFSPDGKWLAFVSDDAGVPQIWVRPVGGGDAVKVTSGLTAAERPRWTPRNEIVFGRSGQGIWLVPALGGEPYRLVADGRLGDVSRDGSLIAIERGGHIWLTHADGSTVRQMENAPPRVFQDFAASPVFSPNARWIALFNQEAGPNGDYWIVPVDGGAARRLTFDVAEGGPPAWTAGGQSLVVSSTRAGSRALWRIPIDGGAPEALTAGAGEDNDPAVSPDDRSIVYSNVRNVWALMIRDGSTSDRAILEQRSSIWLPVFSPDGSSLVFFQPADSGLQIFTVHADGSALRQVTHDNGWNIHPSWSGNGQFIYFYRDRPAPSSFRRLPAEGGPSVEIAAGWQWPTRMHASVDPADAHLVYLRQGLKGEEDTAFVRDIASGREIALAQPHMHGLKWSRDGRFVVGTRHDGTIAICPADGGGCVAIARGSRATWTDGDSRVVFARGGDGPNTLTLWSVRRDAGDERPMGTIGPLSRLNDSFDVSQNGRIAWVQWREGRSELWELTRR